MIDRLIKSIALVDGSVIHTSSTTTMDYEGYLRIFKSEDVTEITVNKEDCYIYAKNFNGIIVILNLDKTVTDSKIGSVSYILLRARVISRELNTMYKNGRPEIKEILKYRIELVKPEEKPVEKQKSESPRLIDSLAMGIYRDIAKKETKKANPSQAKPEIEKVEPRVEKSMTRVGEATPGVQKAEQDINRVEPRVEKSMTRVGEATPGVQKVEINKVEPLVEKSMTRVGEATRVENEPENNENIEDLQALANEIIRLKRSWAEKKKKTDG